MALALRQGLPEEDKLQLTKMLADKRVMITDLSDCTALLKYLLSKVEHGMAKLIKSSIPFEPSIYEEIKGLIQELIADDTNRRSQSLGLLIQNHFTVKTQSDLRNQAMINGFSGLSGFTATSDFAVSTKFSLLTSAPGTRSSSPAPGAPASGFQPATVASRPATPALLAPPRGLSSAVTQGATAEN